MSKESTEMEFDLNEMSKEELMDFISYAHRHNYTINEAIVESLKSIIKTLETNNESNL